MKAAIIGSNGYIGRNLSYFLRSKGIVNFNYDFAENPAFEWMNYSKIDVTNQKHFQKLNSEIDVIFFLAGITGTSDGFDDYQKYYEVNVYGLLNLLNHLKSIDKKIKIIFPSTRLVYGGNNKSKIKENDQLNPISTYAITKVTCENILKNYNLIFGINYDILRICVPYGNLVDSNFSYGTLGFFIDRAIKNQPITLYGDGSQKRTFTSIEDICKILILLAKKNKLSNDVYNIGGTSYSLLEVAQKVAAKYNSQIKFIEWPELQKKLETGDTIFNSKKLDEYLGIEEYSKIDFN